MKCTQEKCPIKDAIGFPVKRCTMHNCSYRTRPENGDDQAADVGSVESCPLRHENGNCLCVGGFCTSVPKEICAAVRQAYDSGYSKGAVDGAESAKTELQPLMAELEEFRKAKAEYRAVIFPVSMADRVYLIRNDGITLCTIRNIKTKSLGGWTMRLYPLTQDWCAPRVTYYEVNIAQFNKTWFKDHDKAVAALNEHRAKKGLKPWLK